MKRLFTLVATVTLALTLILTSTSCAKAYENASDAGYGGGDNYYTGGAMNKGEDLADENLETNRKIIKNVN